MTSLINNSITMILSLINIILFYKFSMKDYYSRLSINTSKRSVEREKYNEYMYINLIDNLDFYTKGFPSKSHETYDWIVTVKNIGSLPSTNIILNLTINVKKSAFEVNNQDEVPEVNNVRLVDAYTINKSIEIPYMGANSQKNISILELTGQFPAAKLYVNYLSSDKGKFISKKVVIDEYIHPIISRNVYSNINKEIEFQDLRESRMFVGLDKY